MTIDDLKALAEKAKAKAWRPKVCERVFDQTNGEMAPCHGCDRCHGAQRACEDIAHRVQWSMMCVGELDDEDRAPARPANLRGAVEYAKNAARIASYFGPESNPVAEFAAAVREFCK